MGAGCVPTEAQRRALCDGPMLCDKTTPCVHITSGVRRSDKRLRAAERGGIADRRAAMAVARGNEGRGIIAKERDPGAVGVVGDIQRANGSIA